MNGNRASIKGQITNIDITDENLTSRAGLTFISRYLKATKISELLGKKFSYLRKSSKGINLSSIFSQILIFFINGESFHLTYFDQLKTNSGYSGVIETPQKQTVSSHSVKNFWLRYVLYFQDMVYSQTFYQLLKNSHDDMVVKKKNYAKSGSFYALQ